jgi:Mlc titration factor MtfA (ptsG expression regulator)
MTLRRALLAGALVSCVAAAVTLYALTQRTRVPVRGFSDQIVIYPSPGTSLQRLNEIVKVVHGEELRPAGFAGTTAWLVTVPWAQDEKDTQGAVLTLLSFPEIKSAEVDERILRKTNATLGVN